MFGYAPMNYTRVRNSGHSRRDTLGPIPKPAVKQTHVVCGTELREYQAAITLLSIENLIISFILLL